MSSESSLTPILQTVSIVAAALAAGTNLSTSIITIPTLISSPPQLLSTQFRDLFYKGAPPVVSCAMSSAVGFGVLAYRAYGAADPSNVLGIPSDAGTGGGVGLKVWMYGGAAAAMFGLAPYTKFLMDEVINELLARADAKGDEKAEGESTHDLVKRWSTFNFYRGVLLLSGAVMGTWASVGL